jgi:anaphase-promoting complex subunit 4
MAQPSSFQVLSEKTLHHAADPNLITFCPSMDLVALATTNQEVLIYRFNGQRAYGAVQKAGNLRVESICWKPNGLSFLTLISVSGIKDSHLAGQLLAIAWSDGSVRLVGAESSKIVHQFTTDDQVSGVTCMSWVTNLASKRFSSLVSEKDLGSWEAFLANEELSFKEKLPLNLPRDLSLIDIETSLPKLSVLAAGGSS